MQQTTSSKMPYAYTSEEQRQENTEAKVIAKMQEDIDNLCQQVAEIKQSIESLIQIRTILNFPGF